MNAILKENVQLHPETSAYENKRGESKTSKASVMEKSSAFQKNSIFYIRAEGDLDIQYVLRKELDLNFIEMKDLSRLETAPPDDPRFIILDFGIACKDSFHAVVFLQKQYPGIEILITVDSQMDSNIIDLMDRGITQFLKLPAEYETIQGKLKFISDLSEHNQIENTIGNKNSQILRKQLEWMNYKNIKHNIGLDSSGKSIIENLRDSLVQTGGYGVMLSMIEVVKEMSEKKGDLYMVEENMIDVLSENAKIAQKNLNGINTALDIMTGKYELERFSSYYILQKVPEMLGEVKKSALKSGNTIYFPKINVLQDTYFKIHYNLFAFAMEELIVNAVKYTNPGSPIHMYANIAEGYFCLNILNEYSSDQPEYFPDNITDHLVKPFLRMHPPVEKNIDAEKISMGLGLTAVYYIMGQINGLLNISNVQDHTGQSIKPSVLSQIFIPICE